MVRKRRNKGEFIELASPFENLSEDELAAVRAAWRTNTGAAFASITATLEKLIQSTPTFRVLGDLAFQFYMNQEGLSSGKNYAIEQHNVEYAQALALRTAPLDGGSDPYAGPAINQIIEALREQSRLSAIRRWPPEDADAEQLARFEVIDGIRSFTEQVRGDFNTYQFDHYMRSILGRIDQRFEAVHGITATMLLDLLMAMLRHVEANLSGFQKGISLLRHAKRGGKAVSTYLRAFPAAACDRALIVANAKAREVPNDQMGQYLFGQAYNHLPRAFSFSIEEIRETIQDHRLIGAATAAVSRWTIEFGELADQTADRLVGDNPVWVRPFVRLGDDRWMWPSPGTLFSGGINMFELLIDDDLKLKEAYSKARADFLEEETARLLQKHLPSATVWTSVKWRDPASSTPYEADVIARIDDVMIVVEAKSGQLNDAARRGADASLKREIRKLMADPAEQSTRFVSHVLSPSFAGELTSAEGPCDIDAARVGQVVRLTVAMETPGPLATAWAKLVEVGFISADIEHAPVLGLSDLDVMLELMGDEATVMHYLLRRTDFERQAEFLADEHDLVAFYLRDGFGMSEVEEGKVWLNVYGMSDTLRNYYSRSPGRQRPQKPRPHRSDLWRRWIDEVSRHKPAKWVTMARMLLDVDYPSQMAIAEQAKQKAAEVRKSPSRSAVRAVIIPTGPTQRRGVVVPVYYKGLGMDEVKEMADDLYLRASQEQGTDRVLVIGIDVANPRPYSFIALRN